MVGIYLDMCMCMFRKLPGHVHVHVWEVLPDDVLTVGPGHCAEPQGGLHALWIGQLGKTKVREDRRRKNLKEFGKIELNYNLSSVMREKKSITI